MNHSLGNSRANLLKNLLFSGLIVDIIVLHGKVHGHYTDYIHEHYMDNETRHLPPAADRLHGYDIHMFFTALLAGL